MSASSIRAESPLEDSMDRKMTNERPEAEEAPAKRMRTDARVEDKARGKRLFGNLLGTLQKFKNEEKTTRGSEAAKRREQVSERIASKIQKESTLHHDIQESEKELKTLRISTESAEFVLRNKDIALTARHSALKPTSRFLHTSKPLPAPSIFVGNLLNPSPIPLNQGPSRAAPHPNELKPLYFLPKILLPEQETELNSQIANLDEMITDEVAALVREKEETTNQVKENKARIEELASKLSELRKEVKPLSIRGRGNKPDVDELGRTRREDMEVEDENREQGVQIRGEDGDVEVEY